jgi:hypothetical protein
MALGCTYPATGKLDVTVQLMALTSSPNNSFTILFGVEKAPFDVQNEAPHSPNGFVYSASSGQRWTSGIGQNYGSSWSATGNIVRFVLSNGTLTFYVNGVSQGVAFSQMTGNFRPVITLLNSGGAGNSVKITALSSQ